ncbi:DUF3658 domain-containing protein [Desulfitobacterium chlororespirans]|uniref:DUF1835 domain-containing protein n=1 Tax=Desulfitobacterium chlororespirans DSM 11544 TaxID=1121395 RepID=A0A1M7TIJ1_9FIRM|nr:DUF3658 domain-containing protein [Desulfitobacterium chlororespirans]SHN70501.1 protein of unknown function [Desulfitobacterium chlororespirans DSM 11544]
MIEIVFGDSACGSLKIAQRFGEGEYKGGCSGVMVIHSDGAKPTQAEIKAAQRKAEEKARLAWERATPLGGKTGDIYGFNLMLSIGDISEDQPGIKRRQTLEKLYSVYPGDTGHQAAQELLGRANENLKTVQERIAAGESLRIWYSNQPDELCGLYWLMEQLVQWKGLGAQVSIVRLPEWEAGENGSIVRKNGWGEVAPEEWHRYLALQKPVSLVFITSCAAYWRELQRENAPLRAMLNGQLVSMSEALYDDFILREIAAAGEVFQEAVIIGQVLGKYQLGIGDAWVAFRIEEMIHAGKLKAVSEVAKDSPIYHRLLKKGTHQG